MPPKGEVHPACANYADDVTSRRQLSADAAVALVVFGATLMLLYSGGYGTSSPGSREFDGLGAVLAFVSAAPLAFRRRIPFLAYLVTCAASLTLASLHYPLDLPFGPLVGAYFLAVAYGGDPRWVRRWSALAAANLFVPAIALLYSRVASPRTLVTELVLWAALFLGAWFAGERTRLRGVQLSELEQRANGARRLAAAEERTRIARELHDSAGHAINVILVQAGAARLLHSRDPAGSQKAIATIEAVARETITDIDKLVRALREDEPPPPANPAALEELLHRYRENGLEIDSEVSGQGTTLPRSVAWAGYRILQEALTNAYRHGPGSAYVALSFEPHAMEITVTNPTNGYRAKLNGGHGIIGMRERATLLGGTLETLADQGIFRLHARLPFHETVI